MPDRVLGSGGFALVIGAEYNGSDVVVKASKFAPRQHRSECQLRQLCDELRLLRRLRHPNIVVVYGACLDVQHSDLMLVMEALYGLTLSDYITHRQPRNLVKVQILADISAALIFRHGRWPPIVHGDLKDTNIFVERCLGRRCVFVWPGDSLCGHGHSATLEAVQ